MRGLMALRALVFRVSHSVSQGRGCCSAVSFALRNQADDPSELLLPVDLKQGRMCAIDLMLLSLVILCVLGARPGS